MRNLNAVKLVLAGLCLCSLAAAQNLVANPDFETGGLTGTLPSWSTATGTGGWAADDSGHAYSGTYYAGSFCSSTLCIAVDPVSTGGWLYQNIPTTPSATYTLTFHYFLGLQSAPAAAELQVLWGPSSSPLTTGGPGVCSGSCVFHDNTSLNSTAYITHTMTVVATSATMRLEFLGRNDALPAGDGFGLDAVSVTLLSAPPTSVPMLSAWAIGILAILLVGIGAWWLKPRFSAVPRA